MSAGDRGLQGKRSLARLEIYICSARHVPHLSRCGSLSARLVSCRTESQIQVGTAAGGVVELWAAALSLFGVLKAHECKMLQLWHETCSLGNGTETFSEPRQVDGRQSGITRDRGGPSVLYNHDQKLIAPNLWLFDSNQTEVKFQVFFFFKLHSGPKQTSPNQLWLCCAKLKSCSGMLKPTVAQQYA